MTSHPVDVVEVCAEVVVLAVEVALEVVEPDDVVEVVVAVVVVETATDLVVLWTVVVEVVVVIVVVFEVELVSVVEAVVVVDVAGGEVFPFGSVFIHERFPVGVDKSCPFAADRFGY